VITPWLEKYWQQCTQALHQGRLAHALLISGCAGLGKLDFAFELAQKILCSAIDEHACGHCQSCHWFLAKSHPDFRVVTPEEEKKQIGVGQIRDLTEAMTRTGYGRYQVVIIHPAEAMNRASANALLKTLEEPNGQVILLLVCDHPARLLPTIRSRCQAFHVQLPTKDVVLPWLEARLVELTVKDKTAPTSKRATVATPADWPAAAELLAIADGLPLRALRFAQTGEWQQYNAISADFVQVLSGKMTALKAAEVWAKQSPSQVLTIIATLVQDMIRLMAGLSAAQIQHRHRATELQQLLQRRSLAQLWSFLADIHVAKRRTLSSANPNTQLLLESVLIPFISGKVL
jgi:DNA polymerase-3 subunit delta'